MLRVHLQTSSDPNRAFDHGVKLLQHENLRHCGGSHSDHEAFYKGLENLRCTCNSSHVVVYSHGADSEAAASADVTIHGVGAGEGVPKVNRSISSSKFMLYLEPPHNLEFTSAPGFDGLVGFRRPEPGLTLGTWFPWCSHQSLWRGVRAWQYDPIRRNDIGVWVSNCDGYPEHWRTSVIDLLLASGLPVNSYGLCRRNAPKEYWDARIDFPVATRDLPDGSPGLCRRHRLMLGVENNACRDWVSRDLCQVVDECGAIPIIKSIWHNGQMLPDYTSLCACGRWSLPLLSIPRLGPITLSLVSTPQGMASGSVHRILPIALPTA